MVAILRDDRFETELNLQEASDGDLNNLPALLEENEESDGE